MFSFEYCKIFKSNHFERTSAGSGFLNCCFWFFKTYTDYRRAAAFCCFCSHQRCSVKTVFLKILLSSQENTYARVSFWIKLYASGMAQEPFLQILWNLKTPFFIKHLRRLLLHHILTIKNFYYYLVSVL